MPGALPDPERQRSPELPKHKELYLSACASAQAQEDRGAKAQCSATLICFFTIKIVKTQAAQAACLLPKRRPLMYLIP